jgi:hypothetical protein
MPPDDDQDWLDALAGKPRPGAAPRTLLEARLLRAVLLEQAQAEPESDAERQNRLERLLFRLRRQGLLDAPRWSQRAWRVPLAAAAALMLGIAVVQLVHWQDEAAPDAPAMRGEDSVRRLVVDDAAQTATAIASALRAEGIDVREYPLGVARGLEVRVAPAQRAGAEAILAPYGIALAPDGRLAIEIANRPK